MKSWIAIFVMIASAPAHAQFLGVAEARFYLAFEHVQRLAYYCSFGGNCGLGNLERLITFGIEECRGKEQEAPHNIQFVSAAKNPGFFEIEGQHKIAKTGLKYGDIIYVNSDAIYHADALGEREPMSYLEILQVVTHELGHHTGLGPADRILDDLGQKFSALAQRLAYSADLQPATGDIRFSSLNTRDLQMSQYDVPNPYLSSGFLTIEDPEKVFTIELGVQQYLADRSHICVHYDPSNPKTCLETLKETDVIQSLQFYNVHWSEIPMSLNPATRNIVKLTGTATLFGWSGHGKKNKLIPLQLNFTFEYEFGIVARGEHYFIDNEPVALTRFRIQEEAAK